MIIGLTGFARAGKDTLGKELVARGFTHLSFAAPLKELALKIDPIVEFDNDGIFQRLSGAVESMGWDRAKFEVYDVRRFLQALGVGAREQFGPDFWVNQVRDQIDYDPVIGLTKDIVITDVRFPNEAEMIKGYGQGYVVQVIRKHVGPLNDHVSERPIDPSLIDLTVNNYGTLKEIPILVDWILDDIKRIKDARAEAARAYIRSMSVPNEFDLASREEVLEAMGDTDAEVDEFGNEPQEDQGGNTDLAGAREAEELNYADYEDRGDDLRASDVEDRY
jgi:hypothetical protein